MGDEFRTVREDVCKALKALGWTSVEVPNSPPDLYAFPRHWILTPPPEPTLAQKMLDLAERLSMSSDFACSNGGYDCLAAADALERAERVEAAARYAVDHQTECGVVERLRNALEAQ